MQQFRGGILHEKTHGIFTHCINQPFSFRMYPSPKANRNDAEAVQLPMTWTIQEPLLSSGVQDVLNIVDNATPYDTLAQTIYTDEEILQCYNMLGKSIVQINRICPIECLRKGNGCYYAILRSDRGTLFLLFDQSGDDLLAFDHWYIRNKITKDEFERLTVGETTVGDIKAFNPYAPFLTVDTGTVVDSPSSTHKTIDGYVVKIEYDMNGSNENAMSWPISRIAIRKAMETGSTFVYLLPIDILALNDSQK